MSQVGVSGAAGSPVYAGLEGTAATFAGLPGIPSEAADNYFPSTKPRAAAGS